MPSCEILSIGTELLLGQIVNTNAQFLSEELGTIGVDCYFQTTVGDNRARIVDTFKRALSRSDVILVTGGLGPTADDLTTECLADTFGVPLIFEQSVLDAIEAFFKTRGYPMPVTNRKQALRPEGSMLLPNPRGTAPGIIWEVWPELLKRADIADPARTRTIMTFPGVPGEMKSMWQETAKPYLVKKFGEGALWSVDLKHYGIGESLLAEKYAHLLENSNPTVAPYAGTGECKLRVTAKAATQEEAQSLARPIVDEIISASGRFFYGTNSDTLEIVVGKLLAERGLTITVAESCTGGLISQRLTEIPGSSAYIKANVVAYANETKEKLLSVPHSVLLEHGAVSSECAKAMAEGARKVADADLGLSVTGIAGPDGGTADKPVGLVYVGLADKDDTIVRKLSFPSQLARKEIRFRSASEALNMVRLYLLGLS
jgi:nicotinamide-nucleotide amidase